MEMSEALSALVTAWGTVNPMQAAHEAKRVELSARADQLTASIEAIKAVGVEVPDVLIMERANVRAQLAQIEPGKAAFKLVGGIVAKDEGTVLGFTTLGEGPDEEHTVWMLRGTPAQFEAVNMAEYQGPRGGRRAAQAFCEGARRMMKANEGEVLVQVGE